MASTKEIQNRINSIQDTMKITNAMYMMSSMKLRKAKSKLQATEPFFEAVQQGLAENLVHFPDIRHIYFDNRVEDEQETTKRRGFVVFTGDKGMAGAYNHNAIKMTLERISNLSKDEYMLYVVGEVGRAFFLNGGYNVDENFHFSSNNPSMHRARVISEYMIEKYNQGELDRIDIIYTKMLNSVTEETCVERLLPLKTQKFIREKVKEIQDDVEGTGKAASEMKAGIKHVHSINSYEMEAFSKGGDKWFPFYPSLKEVLEQLVHNNFTGFIYGALVECSASEENARMMAMQSATDNAQAILRELSIEYNRVRQAQITQEITEVIGGAKALKKKKAKKKAVKG
ncbi:F-type H+-transporting ATPase subunit gamma [Pseudobutyrivibrio sp. ACV-2]|uniref:ATP synthase F1 subunit gamma n=1 Tax=Pseudobutyrivibrio sp. ACV-2 TaxID=1520801 RepID=UPI00089450D8|nr:ATP synthase F1 subunit gamma [Pseudobutyrivibrio sp. ACV-2]SEA17677.1 F-type H+-transporting ATPase subunit gamma [Pseudobutyrivibrio sp. ACV-2]